MVLVEARQRRAQNRALRTHARLRVREELRAPLARLRACVEARVLSTCVRARMEVRVLSAWLRCDVFWCKCLGLFVLNMDWYTSFYR